MPDREMPWKLSGDFFIGFPKFSGQEAGFLLFIIHNKIYRVNKMNSKMIKGLAFKAFSKAMQAVTYVFRAVQETIVQDDLKDAENGIGNFAHAYGFGCYSLEEDKKELTIEQLEDNLRYLQAHKRRLNMN